MKIRYLLLQTKDTLVSFSNDTSLSDNSLSSIIVVGIIFLGLFLYSFYKSKKDSKTFNDAVVNTDNISDGISVLENKNQKVTLNKGVGFSQEVSSIDNSEPKLLTTEILKTVAEQDEKSQPISTQEEESTMEKYIGYDPINLFTQTEPLNFPYIIMPPPRCVIKFPRKGRLRRKGFKEEAFKEYVERYFKSTHQLFDDRFVLVKSKSKPYEPDFTLINEKNGINIFLDIEIDEPYEGTNDIKNRRPTHYKHADTYRNSAFKNRGWIVIRFAEIQVHQQPDSCCKLIADVLKSIDSSYRVPDQLLKINNIYSIPQWSEDEARQWSLDKYRERYLGILQFGISLNPEVTGDIEETELGNAVEEKVIDEEIQIKLATNLNSFHKIYMASVTGKYVSFVTRETKTVFKPIYVYDHETSGYCYVKNEVTTYKIAELENIIIKDNYYTVRLSGPTLGINRISNIVNTAIDYKKFIRIKYTRIAWQNMLVDIETGELIIDKVDTEESVRTVSNVQLSINALTEEHILSYRLDSNYLTAYCHKRKEQRTFRFDRIGEIEVLDL